MSWRAEQDEANKIADAMVQYAMTHTYSGPNSSEDLFDGWPLTTLAAAAFPNMPKSLLIKGIICMKQRYHNPRSLINTPVIPVRETYNLEEMLAMRMHWAKGEWPPGFTHIAIHNVGGATAHIWVITKDAKSVVLEDDIALFPSDALIAKLTMLKQE